MTSRFLEIKQSTRLVYLLGIQDLKHAYRRSALGPFWISIGMAVQTLATGLVFSLLFKIELEDYLPFLSLNIVIWSLISTSINESCASVVQAEPLIKQIKLPTYIHSARIIWKNLLIGAHNALILPIVFVIYWKHEIQVIGLLSILGLALLIYILAMFGYVLSVICLRFRDLTPIVSSLVNVLYFVTPIMWKPELLGNDGLAHLLLGINPLYHCFQVVRLPIFGQSPTLENWIGVLVLAAIGTGLAIAISKKFSNRLVYWL